MEPPSNQYNSSYIMPTLITEVFATYNTVQYVLKEQPIDNISWSNNQCSQRTPFLMVISILQNCKFYMSSITMVSL